MRGLLTIMFIAAFVMLCVHIIKTDVETNQTEKKAIQFAKYCYENNYAPKECK